MKILIQQLKLVLQNNSIYNKLPLPTTDYPLLTTLFPKSNYGNI